MIGVYRAARTGTGTIADPYRCVLDSLMGPGDTYDEVINPAQNMSICIVSASAATHTAISNYAKAQKVSITLLLDLCADLPALIAQLQARFDSLNAVVRRRITDELALDGVVPTSTDSLMLAIRSLLCKYFSNQAVSRGRPEPTSFRAFTFGGLSF